MRARYYGASVITLAGGNTTAYGGGCEPGRRLHRAGRVLGPRRRPLDVHPSRDDVGPDIYPDDCPLSPAQWLAEQVTERLGDLDYIDAPTFGGARTATEPRSAHRTRRRLARGVAGTSTFLGDLFAAYRLRTAPASTRTVTATAHAHGFTDTELAEAVILLGPDKAAPGLD